MLIEIPEQLGERLKALAERHNCSVIELLELLTDLHEVTYFSAEIEAGLPPRGTAARAAYEARRSTFDSGKTDTAQRSREILTGEYADYALRKQSVDE